MCISMISYYKKEKESKNLKRDKKNLTNHFLKDDIAFLNNTMRE